jgi:hypothetical protein
MSNEKFETKKVQGQSYNELTKNENDKDAKTITVPSMTVINQRIFCEAFAAAKTKDEKTGLFLDNYVKFNKKDGSLKSIPRFIVAKCSEDIFVHLPDGEEQIFLEPGTEVFPFFPDVEDYSFPTVKDPETNIEYTVFHFTELAGYLEFKKEVKKVKK